MSTMKKFLCFIFGHRWKFSRQKSPLLPNPKNIIAAFVCERCFDLKLEKINKLDNSKVLE